MSIISQIMEVSKANSGFTGGSFVDTMPGHSIEECAQSVCYEMQQSIIECVDISEKLNETVLGALTESVKSGTPIDTYDAINEAQEASANKRQQAFENIKAFINNIIAKLTEFINSLRNHTKFIQQNSNVFKAANFNDKKINGYPFPALMGQNENNVINLDGLNIENYDGLISAAKIKEGAADAATVQKNIDDWFIAQTRIRIPANSQGSIKDSLHDLLYGGKEAVELPMNNFNRDSVIRVLANANTLRGVQSNYKKAARVINDMITENRRAVVSGMKSGNASKEGGTVNVNNQETGMVDAQKQISLAQAAFTEYSNLMAVATSYARALWAQAWNIFRTGVGVANKAVREGQKRDNEITRNAKKGNAGNTNATANESVITEGENCGGEGECKGEGKGGHGKGECHGKGKKLKEEAVDDTDELKSAYDESADVDDDDFDFSL